MTLEERQLLLRDISARLPYGVYVHFCNTNIDEKLTEISLGETINQIRHNGKGNQGLIKPYLRPMSSMTDEEREEWADLFMKPICELEHYADEKEAQDAAPILYGKSHSDSIDWLNKHHFDYRGLIEKGLALEAKEGMYE